MADPATNPPHTGELPGARRVRPWVKVLWWSLGITLGLFVALVIAVNVLGGMHSHEPESRGISYLRTINTATISYQAAHPELGFPRRLVDMAAYLDAGLISGRKRGYVLRYTPGAPDAHGRVNSYTAVTRPENKEVGRCSFFTDESAVIRMTCEDREPAATDPAI